MLDGMANQKKADTKKDEYLAWLNGYYVQLAVAAVLNGNKSRYPLQPLGEEATNNPNSGHIVATDAMSEEEKERTRKLFLANLQEMQRKFEGRRK